jgi:D-3-phosphoglycerate dehydrogenase
MEYATQKGITVLSLRGEFEFLRSIPATAEHTWGLLLALVRNIPAAFSDVQNGHWRRDRFKGHDLRERRLGIVGLGRIGEKIANYGQAFGMHVSAYDPYCHTWLPSVKKYDKLEELASESDVLSVHVPFTPETKNLIDVVVLNCTPRGAYLVNTSRGGVLDEDALLNVLVSGHIAGAALDVLANEQEFNKKSHSPLLDYARIHDNLIITPHIGGATYESMRATEVFMAYKLKAHLKLELQI